MTARDADLTAVSDLAIVLVLEAPCQRSRRRHRAALDPRWTTCRAGGIDKSRFEKGRRFP
jgi:hypothetical protein